MRSLTHEQPVVEVPIKKGKKRQASLPGLKHLQVFTTGEAAKACKVSQQTIIRCFDSGELKGFRVPGSRFRRIPRAALFKFMKDNSIPTDVLDVGEIGVATLVSEDFHYQIADVVDGQEHSYRIDDAEDDFSLGALVRTPGVPHSLVIVEQGIAANTEAIRAGLEKLGLPLAVIRQATDEDLPDDLVLHPVTFAADLQALLARVEAGEFCVDPADDEGE